MESRAIEAPDAGPKRSRLTLWLMLAACAAPVIASYAAYYFWPPGAHVNYGEILAPRPLPDIVLAAADGRAFRLAELKGRWVLLMAAAPACDERCRQSLVYMRQVRLAQGREADRIERVWLLTGAGAPDPALLAEHAGLIVARDGEAGAPDAASSPDRIHVVDPLGNLMMRYPVEADPRRMLKDIARLLRHSKWK